MLKNKKNRWEKYFLKYDDEFNIFWSKYLSNNKRVLYILGLGFDPRTNIGIKSILNLSNNSTIHCVLIDYDEGQTSPSRNFAHLKKTNLEDFHKIIFGKATNEVRQISMETSSGNQIGAREASKIFQNLDDLKSYSDIIVDISALPVILYFPLIGKILHILDTDNTSEKVINLHVIVSENPEIDSKIRDMELDNRAKYLFSFTNGLELADKKDKIWIPILGENQSTQLERIKTLIENCEICPLLPSPSSNPRRADKLILDYGDFFDKHKVEIRNIIYGSEQNPFEVYRQILATIYSYQETFSIRGGCKVALSALSSKLLSIAPFLVAYEYRGNRELRIGIAHISAKGFHISEEALGQSVINNSKLFSMWLKGECYLD